MAPVQTVVTGPRSLFGSPAHVDTSSRITQSMCRSIGAKGQIQSACVACQAPCIDIDAERAYWQTLTGKPGLTWAWWSYPGLVIAFFLLIKDQSPAGIDYLRSGMWAYDQQALTKAWLPLNGIWTMGLPRLVTIPLLLVLAAALSVGIFSRLQAFQEQLLSPELGERAPELARSRTRLLATFMGVNAFFWFADPLIGMAGPAGGQVIRSLVLIASGMVLYRGWHRDRGDYTRESTSASLRKQLQKLIPALSPYLDGRTLADLSASEVFTLARVLPIQITETKRSIYRGVMADLLGTGRLERAASLVQLEELRRSLDLVEEDHFATVRELALQDPRILKLDALQRESRTLRQEAAAEAIEELMGATRTLEGNDLLRQDHLRDRLEEIRGRFTLDEASWEELLGRFGPASRYAREALRTELDSLRHQLAARESLERAGVADPLLRPLMSVLDRRITSHVVTITPALQAFPPDEPLVRELAALRPLFPPSVRRLIRGRDQHLPEPAAGDMPPPLDPRPDPADLLDELWRDPDPDTALWVLWVQLRRNPTRGEALRHTPRVGLPGSPGLDRLLRGEGMEGAELMDRLLAVPLVAGLSPAALFSLVRWGEPRRWEPGEALFAIGDPTDFVAVLLEGSCRVLAPQPAAVDGEGLVPIATVAAGEPLGEVSFFTDRPRQVSIRAGNAPVLALVFDSVHFESLLQQSSEFSSGLLREMAVKIVGLYERAGRQDEAPQPVRP
jgi:hypothetical protein